MTVLGDIEFRKMDGSIGTLADHAGDVVLVVNVASQCGLTPQYAGLQELYDSYKDRGLVVLGFPCDQFGHQEPGTAAEIQAFCSLTYDVTFPMFAKIDVNGERAHPLYRFLKAEKKGLLGSEAIKWNFTKFLVDRRGVVLKRYGSSDSPDSIAPDIERALAS